MYLKIELSFVIHKFITAITINKLMDFYLVLTKQVKLTKQEPLIYYAECQPQQT